MQLRRWAAGPVVAILAGFALAACGGGGEPVSDEEYVRTICSTIGNLQARIGELSEEGQDANSTDAVQEMLENLSGALDDAADDLDDVNPPEDVADSHGEVVDAFRSAAEAMAEGEIEALQELDLGEIEQDAAAQERLGTVAQDVEECSGLGLF